MSKRKRRSVQKKKTATKGNWLENIRAIRPKRKGKINLPPGTHIVQEMDADSLHKKIHELVKQITENILNGQDPQLEIPTRSADNVIYDMENDLLLLGSKKIKRSLVNFLIQILFLGLSLIKK